jgi:hypothetical protein
MRLSSGAGALGRPLRRFSLVGPAPGLFRTDSAPFRTTSNKFGAVTLNFVASETYRGFGVCQGHRLVWKTSRCSRTKSGTFLQTVYRFRRALISGFGLPPPTNLSNVTSACNPSGFPVRGSVEKANRHPYHRTAWDDATFGLC